MHLTFPPECDVQWNASLCETRDVVLMMAKSGAHTFGTMSIPEFLEFHENNCRVVEQYVRRQAAKTLRAAA